MTCWRDACDPKRVGGRPAISNVQAGRLRSNVRGRLARKQSARLRSTQSETVTQIHSIHRRQTILAIDLSGSVDKHRLTRTCRPKLADRH